MKFKSLKLTLALSLILTMILVSACSSSNSDNASSSPAASGASPAASGNSGKTLKVLYATVEADDAAIKAQIPEFEKATGMKIELTTEPYNNLQQKVFQELSTKSDHYDVMVIDTPWMPALTGELLPLSSFLEKPEVASKVNLGDFIPKVFFDTAVYNPEKPWVFPPADLELDAAKIKAAGFEIYGMPIQANGNTVAYRKDLFEDQANKDEFKKKYGRDLAVPNTWDEFLDVAKFFTKPDQNMWGTTLLPATTDGAATSDFKSFLGSWGGNGRLLNDQVKPEFNSKEAVEALTFYNDMINKDKVVPPGATTFGWEEAGTAFDSGMTATTSGYHTLELASNVKGQIDYFLFPGKEVGGKLVRGPHFGTWQLSINKYSKNPDAAFEMISWFTSQQTQEKMLEQQLHPTRTSVFKYAEGNADLTAKFGSFYKVLGETLAIGIGRPRISNYSEVSNALAVMVNNIVTNNGNIQSELDSGEQNVITLLKQAGYDPGNQ
jgi:multiple sugar transport system substrate-binding protein